MGTFKVLLLIFPKVDPANTDWGRYAKQPAAQIIAGAKISVGHWRPLKKCKCDLRLH